MPATRHFTGQDAPVPDSLWPAGDNSVHHQLLAKVSLTSSETEEIALAMEMADKNIKTTRTLPEEEGMRSTC